MPRHLGRVNWSQGPASSPGPALVRRHNAKVDAVPEEKLEEYVQALHPGNLFVITSPLVKEIESAYLIPPPYPILRPKTARNPGPVIAPKGSTVIYLGPIRIEESTRHGSVRVVRHSFLVPAMGGPAIILKISTLKPLTGEDT